MSWLLGHAEKRLDSKDNVNSKIYDVTAWLTNNWNTFTAQYLRSKGDQTMRSCHLIKYNKINIFLQKLCTRCGGETFHRPLF